MEKTRIKKIAVIILAVVVCLFALLLIQCRKYALQNQELQAENEELSGTLEVRNITINAMSDEIERLRNMLAEEEPYETATGYIREGGVYYINNSSQLLQLKQMIADGEEIEPGVPAAEASYRLRQNLEMSDWFYIGTEEAPFSGSFDGDGHSISGKFPFMNGKNLPGAIFQTSSAARIENLQILNGMEQSSQIMVSQSVEYQWECEELVENLVSFPNCRVRLSVYNGNFDTQEIADELRERWERNQEQDGFCISINFYYSELEERPGGETYTQNAMTPFCAIAGDEFEKIIEEAIEQEMGYLQFMKLERIGELNYCCFETGQLDGRFAPRDGDGYHVVLEGKWEGEEVPLQYFYIPYTDYESAMLAICEINDNYRVEDVDIDFDGKKDLLIHEGNSGGSGGSWSNYRAIVWRGEGRFEYYPSFPEQAHCLEFDKQRVISRGRSGASYEYVIVYEVVNGEYVCTRELVDEETYIEGNVVETLSYYEMGELVETHVLQSPDERGQLYPDMDYWILG